MQQFMGLRGRGLSHAIGVVAALIFFLYGYDQGDMGGFLTVPSFLTQFPQIGVLFKPGDLHVAQLTGFTVAIWNLGCFVSAMVAIFVGDILGRKKMMYIGLAVLLIGEIIQCSAFQWGQFVAGRFIAGFGNGFNCATVPAWQAECTKAHRRGTVLMLSAGASIAAGLSFSYWIDFGFAWLDPDSAAWRVPIALQIIFILIAISVLVFLPESPRWLILQGREDEALNVLSALNDSEPDTYEIRQEFLQIKDAVVEMAKASFSNAFRMGDYRDLHRVVLAVVLQFFQQIGGINFMTQYYAQMFSQQYIWDPWVARLLASGAGTCFFLFSFVAVWCIDRVCGRRPLMLFGTSGMLVCMIILTIMLEVNNRASLDAGTAFVWVFCVFWAIGWQGMSWLYQVEIVPLRIRGPANALSTGANWLANFVVVLMAPVAFNNTKWMTYLIFVSTNAVILPTVYFLYPETGLRCLEEVDYIFHTANSSPRPWFDVVKIANDEPLWYGKDNEDPYDYEASEWHQRHVRFSPEVKDSQGESTTLQGSSDDGGMEKVGSNGSTSEEGWKYPGDDVAPSPHISTASGRTSRSAGRGA
ncbi:Sugar transporter STL1 [Lecanosticta acicola]|uniref:Sugar transporter STL1 n=1 Tax=Lecanosticta acicola TaxID=111012 RepID=A0AAI8YX75_9PEZI|nr:Sugar transporter STL1 [Lecanosticta acicola]